MEEKHWERRRSFRIPIAGKALLQIAERFEGIYDVKDVSIDGCRLVDGPCGCDVGTRVLVTMHVQDALDVELEARVVRKTVWGSDGQLGLHFVQPTAAFQDQIQDWTMHTLEDGSFGDILIVHSQPERESVLLDAIRALGHRVVIAKTARETLTVLDEGAVGIHLALVSPIIGRSRVRDVMKLIVSRSPHVRCMPLTHHATDALLTAIRQGMRAAAEASAAWSLSRLHKAGDAVDRELATA